MRQLWNEVQLKQAMKSEEPKDVATSYKAGPSLPFSSSAGPAASQVNPSHAGHSNHLPNSNADKSLAPHGILKV